MSKAVKARKAAQREAFTFGKLINAIQKQEQARAKGNPQEKYRQELKKKLQKVSYSNLFDNF